MKMLEALAPEDRDRELALSLDPERIPAHIAIIMDGNGRWAKRRGLPRVAGHKFGVSTVRSVVEDCANLGVKALTLYAFSAENWKRPRAEIDVLWRLLRFYLRHELADLQRNNICLQSIGHVEALPARAYEELRAVERATERNSGMRLNLAINYSARIEIVDAVNAILDEARIEGRLSDLVIDEKTISRRLYTADLPEPDLLIRTSGEMRVSNFLLWQIAYAELYVTDTLWPDFNRTELLRAILDFQKRERRFGGLPVASQVEPEAAEYQMRDEELEIAGIGVSTQ
ncbi:MAG TPA: isoprenyl transferase [Bryobacteraceae bacterium]|jgi:undecaprenyl diphosphate synthase|nr:isoprenyl transferase [Bryobacteraceae bacterium]